MSQITSISILVAVVIALGLVYLYTRPAEVDIAKELARISDRSTAETATTILASGCFWCVESDFEKLDGVISVESGYAGANATRGNMPTYDNYSKLGYREAVKVTYDTGRLSYANLVEYLIKHGKGSVFDKYMSKNFAHTMACW